MRDCPKFFLGGFTPLRDEQEYGDMFATFWSNFQTIQPSHPIYSQKSDEERRRCIPYAWHGDEGRGLCKVPLLVLSYQVLIPFTGPDNLNLAPQHVKQL